MTTLNEMIEIIRAENPNGLRTGNDQTGYVDLSDTDYKAKIAEWASARLAKQTAQTNNEADKAALLNKLGITAAEAKLLLS